MIRLSNGHNFEYMASAAMLGYDGQGWPAQQVFRLPGILNPEWEIFNPNLFTLVTKTLTPAPLRGNFRWTKPWETIQLVPNGVANDIGLTNIGLGQWSKYFAPRIHRKKAPVIVSITADDPEQLGLMAAKVSNFDIVGIEFNASCPNASAKTPSTVVAGCRAIKEKTSLPLILKLSIVDQAEEILPEIRNLVEALSINSVPWSKVYAKKANPFSSYDGGAVSGGAVQQITWSFARYLRAHTSIPIIGPSVWRYDDIQTLRLQGMSAISFGSIWLRYPWKPTIFVRRDVARPADRWVAKQQKEPYYV